MTEWLSYTLCSVVDVIPMTLSIPLILQHTTDSDINVTKYHSTTWITLFLCQSTH